MNGSQPQDFRVRSYMVLNTTGFLRERLGEQAATQVLQGLSAETRHLISAAKPAEWWPVATYAEVLGAVAGTAHGNEAQARDALIASGEYVAREATNTFLRLLMKMLTPALFAKKLPDFWRRDSSRGRLEVELTEQKLVCRQFDMKGFDHVPCTGAGFAKFAFGAMGKSIESVTIRNWSLAAPCEDGASFELTWKA